MVNVIVRGKRLSRKGMGFWKIFFVSFFLFIVLILILLVLLLYFVFADRSVEPTSRPDKPYVPPITQRGETQDQRDSDNGNLVSGDGVGGSQSDSGGDDAVEYLDYDVETVHVDYLMYEMQAYQLHNPPFSSAEPIIEVEVEGENYIVEVEDGVIKTSSGATEKEDLAIITTKNAVFTAISTDDVVGTIRESIIRGETQVELKASKKTLLLKGYINIYEQATGDKVLLSPGEAKGYSIVFLLVAIVFVGFILFFVLRNSMRKK
jgi:hypothetical protein